MKSGANTRQERNLTSEIGALFRACIASKFHGN